MDPLFEQTILLNPRIEHAQSTDLGNPWIAQHIHGLPNISKDSVDYLIKVQIWAIHGLPPYPRIENWHAIANALAVCLGKKSVQN